MGNSPAAPQVSPSWGFGGWGSETETCLHVLVLELVIVQGIALDFVKVLVVELGPVLELEPVLELGPLLELEPVLELRPVLELGPVPELGPVLELGPALEPGPVLELGTEVEHGPVLDSGAVLLTVLVPVQGIVRELAQANELDISFGSRLPNVKMFGYVEVLEQGAETGSCLLLSGLTGLDMHWTWAAESCHLVPEQGGSLQAIQLAQVATA